MLNLSALFESEQWSLHEHAQAFVAAINWKHEPWIWAIFCCHLLLLLVTLLFRSSLVIQGGILVIITLAVSLLERINRWCAGHWQSFATQDYFDQSGWFLTIVVAVPLMLIGVLILFRAIYDASSLLIQVKKMQFTQEQKEKQKKE
jgi:hypothetical protein